jgi:CheY-like chemotaxis protein
VARESASGRPFQLLLLDWRMPGMDGVECLARLTRGGQPAPPAVLMVTAFNRDEAERQLQARRLQPAALLPKPVMPATLLDACAAALGFAPEHPGRTEQRQRLLQSHQGGLAGAHLLLVEDNSVNQELACDLLNRAGIAVSVADDGREALALLARQSFDGVLMDCQMPVMDGYAATLELRRNPAWRDLPVIAMTANAMAGDREKVLAVGMNDHIAKPIRVDDLYATLARWIRPAPAARQAPGASPPTAVEFRSPASSVDQALHRRLLGMFRQQEADFEPRVRRLLESGDLGAAMRAAHDLRTEAGALGMPALEQAAAVLETACIDNHPRSTIESLLAEAARLLKPHLTEAPVATGAA